MKNVKTTGKLVFEKSSFKDPNEKHEQTIQHHVFNYSVSMNE